MRIYFIYILSIFLISCTEDAPVIIPMEAMIINNLHAPTTSSPGQPAAGKFVKFSFSEQKIVEDDNWDIALRGTTILVNGGFSGSSDEPSRSGLGGGYVETGNYGSIKSIDESKVKQDSESEKAIPIGSGKGWYDYDFQSHVITPRAGRTLIFKTHNGRYAKMMITSYYKDSPDVPNALLHESQYYSFNYTYQPNEGVTNFN